MRAPRSSAGADPASGADEQPSVRLELRPLSGTRRHAARLTLCNPRLRNALTLDMYGQLKRACEEIDAQDSVLLTVVRGAAGAAFAAGTDIREFRDFSSGEDGVAYEHRVGRAVERLAGLRMPVVAAVEGPAVGAGTVLAAACDLVLCTPDATFGAPIGRSLGNCLAPGALARLYACFGRGRALHALLTARLITADEAHEAGFVREIVDRDRMDARIDALSDEIARCAPLTLAAVKEADRRVLAAAAPAHADDLYRRCYGSRDFREGVDAFLSKRSPRWEGR